MAGAEVDAEVEAEVEADLEGKHRPRLHREEAGGWVELRVTHQVRRQVRRVLVWEALLARRRSDVRAPQRWPVQLVVTPSARERSDCSLAERQCRLARQLVRLRL